MNNQKLSIDEFNSYKERLKFIIKRSKNLSTYALSNQNSSLKYDVNEEYYELQSELLSYDLSDIPHNEWAGVTIISDKEHLADFSKSKANIDFGIIKYTPYANYKNCNIKNILNLTGIINSQSFDKNIIEKNPQYFLSDIFSEIIKQKFYNQKLIIDDLFSFSHAQIKELQFKNLVACFEPETRNLINMIGLNTAIKLCFTIKDDYQAVYDISKSLIFKDTLEEYEFKEKLHSADLTEIKNIIYAKIRDQIINFPHFSFKNLPEHFKENNTDLFLSIEAPADLQRYFYNETNDEPLTFKKLTEHKEWLPYLKDKSLTTALMRNSDSLAERKQFFEIFGDKALRLGMNRTETVEKMVHTNKVTLMKQWYDKTGGKFIPDFVIMENFSITEADKFLTSASIWSNLMRLTNYAQMPQTREAMLKVAYSFGAFDGDQRGIKKLQELLTGLPKKITSEYAHIIEYIDYKITTHIQNSTSNNSFDSSPIQNLLEAIKKENLVIDLSQNIFSQIYRKNEDGSYRLNMNTQNYPKTTQAIRSILEQYESLPIVTPNNIHKLFGGFELKYDTAFREFFVTNLDEVLNNSENIKLLSRIQRKFTEIKILNSNINLTLELANNYVKKFKYEFVNVGNELAAHEISSAQKSNKKAYTQKDFETLQKIYNYGKQRTFSSIPRIEKTVNGYFYQMLRLDDPLAMTIGSRTNCCQELGHNAEVCMEHSMVDVNGRIFVIKDEEGNIVAQSWVWRNKDVLCFDNIEIPDKAFDRAIRNNLLLGRKGFTDEIYNIYKQAAHDLMAQDEEGYQELLNTGHITQAEYDGLRLGKITVGLGSNDIEGSLKQNSPKDEEPISRPLPFDEPVKLSRELYTIDSEIQYVLAERQDRQNYSGQTLPVYHDAYIEYSDTTFNEKLLLSLENLEMVTKDNHSSLKTFVEERENSKHLVTAIAKNYGLNPETTGIIINPNFAIIYSSDDKYLKIGDLLFNLKVDNDSQQIDITDRVVMQIKLALEQISTGKIIDISNLNEKQKVIYTKASKLTDELDIERGVGHAK